MRDISQGEAFVLAAALYLHDLGMAAAATAEGAKRLVASPQYRATFDRLTQAGTNEKIAATLALRHAARELHASIAQALASDPVPGLDRYLIESSDVRANWGSMIGQVAHSHHWTLPEVDRLLGRKGRIPDAAGNSVDLGYVACLLRIIDYAHITMDRAPSIERLLRQHLPAESSVHWDAQEHITGPTREGNQLVYASRRGIASVDGWWTFFEMATGLDAEITTVHEYLSSRAASVGRFSLEGVKGVRSPQTFAAAVTTDGFDPVDVRFRPQSMDRLIQILGGRTLYGADVFAPIRELLQNATDALSIRQIELASAGVSAEPLGIRVAIEPSGQRWDLVVSDNGIGMSAHVVTNYLLGVAADYWNSPDYFSEYSASARSGFKPVGRFGIGFLSVFMLGDEVEVLTQRRGGPRLRLLLRGIGQRGSLEKLAATYQDGTSVRIRLSSEATENLLDDLPGIVLAKAPMLKFPIIVATPSGESELRPDWWRTATQEELSSFVMTQPIRSTTPKRNVSKYKGVQFTRLRNVGGNLVGVSIDSLADLPSMSKWPNQQPEARTETSRVLAVPGMNSILLCSKGFSVARDDAPGLLGLVDIGEHALNAARSEALVWDRDRHREQFLQVLKPHILLALDSLVDEGDVPARYSFIADVADKYGIDVLLESALQWITVRERPGSGLLISSADLVRRASSSNEVLLAYGCDPWTAERNARHIFPQLSAGALVIPITKEGQSDPGSYRDEDEIFEAPLEEHFSVEPYRRAGGDAGGAILLHATVALVARAWEMKAGSLAADWKRRKRILYGRLVRRVT